MQIVHHESRSPENHDNLEERGGCDGRERVFRET